MNPFSTHVLSKDVFSGAKAAVGNSRVILAADFDNIQFTLLSAVKATIGTVVGTFVVGELITGGTSAATGRIAAVTSTLITIIDVTGAFTNGETITGGTSGATAVISATTLPNFLVQLFKSNNPANLPPDPSLPVSATNQYSQIAYSDEQGGVNYDTAHPFSSAYDVNINPLPYDQKVFKALTQGAMWVFLKISTYTSGSLAYSEIDLFNN